jgi:hypothetical protein
MPPTYPHGSQRLRRQFCIFDSQRIAYTRSGSEPVVLLLHGLGGTADFCNQ